jgi:hypothetical protein
LAAAPRREEVPLFLRGTPYEIYRENDLLRWTEVLRDERSLGSHVDRALAEPFYPNTAVQSQLGCDS